MTGVVGILEREARKGGQGKRGGSDKDGSLHDENPSEESPMSATLLARF